MSRKPATTLLACVLLDVGGTLWPDSWAAPAKVAAAQIINLGAVLRAVGHDPDLAPGLRQRLLAAMAEHAWRTQQDGSLIQDTMGVVRNTLHNAGLPSDHATVTAIRKAMRVSPGGYAELFPGARELLATIKALALYCVAVSNAHWRDSDDYRQDFAELGVAHFFNAVISSVDVGFSKPHHAMFDAALAVGDWPAAQCVMVGNSECNDAEPAHALGMRTILVALEEEPPTRSSADGVALSLDGVAAILRTWVAVATPEGRQ